MLTDLIPVVKVVSKSAYAASIPLYPYFSKAADGTLTMLTGTVDGKPVVECRTISKALTAVIVDEATFKALPVKLDSRGQSYVSVTVQGTAMLTDTLDQNLKPIAYVMATKVVENQHAGAGNSQPGKPQF